MLAKKIAQLLPLKVTYKFSLKLKLLVIKQRESEWHERQLLKEEKYRRRQQEMEQDSWNNNGKTFYLKSCTQ